MPSAKKLDKRQIYESYQRLKGIGIPASKAEEFLATATKCGTRTIRRWVAEQKKIFDKELLQKMQPLAIGNQIGDDAGEILELGDFTPETSEDYEIKPSAVKAFAKFDEGDAYILNQSRTERWLVIPDLQIPFHDQRSLDAVLSYASEIYFDGVIQLGDFLDWEFCSRWTKENARKIEGKRFLEEYIHGNAVLDQIQAAVRNQNANAHIVIIEGNHDFRVEDVINKTPALEGLIEMERNLRLEERNITYWRYWTHRKPFIVGKVWFVHGEYIGANHAKKMADSFHRNVMYGHTHDVMSYTKTTAWGDSVMCSSLGTLSVLDLEYMGHKPSNWVQNFSEFFIQPNGNFNHYNTTIIDHSFTAINGRFYKG